MKVRKDKQGKNHKKKGIKENKQMAQEERFTKLKVVDGNIILERRYTAEISKTKILQKLGRDLLDIQREIDDARASKQRIQSQIDSIEAIT